MVTKHGRALVQRRIPHRRKLFRRCASDALSAAVQLVEQAVNAPEITRRVAKSRACAALAAVMARSAAVRSASGPAPSRNASTNDTN